MTIEAKSVLKTILRVIMKIAEALFYLALVALICLFFTGNGVFIYEAF